MKKLLKQTFKLTFILLMLFLSSCEKDLYDEMIKEKKRPDVKVSMKEVKNSPEIVSKLRKNFPSKLKTSSNARGADFLLTLQGDFGNVKLDNVLEVVKLNEKAFTFEIDETVKEPNVYLNLVIDAKDNIWLYKIDKIVQQYKDYPINSERLVRFRLNNDLTHQPSTPCDTIIYPPFQPDPVEPTTGGGDNVFNGQWQGNYQPGGGFFPPTIISTPVGGTDGASSSSSGSSGGGGGDDDTNVFQVIGEAITEAWNWLVLLFTSDPKPQSSGCQCSHRYSNVVILDVPSNPCDEGGTIAIIPQSPTLDKIYQLNDLLGNQLGYENKMYFYNTGLYLDYFLNLAQNPPANYNYSEILPVLITYVRKTGNFEFVEWTNNFLLNNPNVTWEKFKSWYFEDREGLEATGLNELENVNFAPQNLPTFDDFILAYPSHFDPDFETQYQVYAAVGGDVMAKYNQGARNTCALRVSRALNYSGVTIPNIPGVTVKGADNKNYFLVAKNLLAWMKATFGTPTGSNHLTAADGGENGINFPNLLSGKQGIYVMIPNDPGQFEASGHVDLFWNGDCDGGCYFNPPGGVKDIYFGELN